MKAQIVLITGGSSGIGAATARILAEKGMTVYAASRRGSSEASDTPGVVPVRLDVNDEAATRALVEEIVAREGRLDAVVVNAGNGIAARRPPTRNCATRRRPACSGPTRPSAPASPFSGNRARAASSPSPPSPPSSPSHSRARTAASRPPC